MTLDKLTIGQSARILQVAGKGELRHHLLDMGLNPGVEVTLRKVAPMGDPIELELRGYELTLRLDDAGQIEVEAVEPTPHAAQPAGRYSAIAHPGVGELGRAKSYRANKIGETIPKGQPLTFALVGNQNCGKTTLFNQLTGSNQHVGNFPGVTVDRKDGVIRSHPEATVTDLPGIYSLSPYSNEEIVTRDFLMKTQPTGIINIVDASNIERNLYLTMQLMELGIPMVLALNMMDEVRANGGSVRINELEEILGIPVVPISAAKNEGIDELIDHALHVARHREAPGRIDFCTDNGQPDDPVSAVHRCIHAAVHLLEPNAKAAGLPVRFACTKMIENDPLIEKAMELTEPEKATLGRIIGLMEKEGGLDREAALANMRFAFIETLCAKTVVKPQESREHKRSVAIDKILTGRYTAIPCFIGIMALVFVTTFSLIGAFLSDLMSLGVEAITNLVDQGLTAYQINPVVRSLVVDGALNGVGSVLSFLPTIVVLFFFLSILEDTGYMARVAFIMDKPLRRIGLSGRSFVPMLIGFGCSVPAIMSTRTLSSDRDRRMTILLTPFMSCSAKLPIYGLLTSAFFAPQWRGLVMVGLYLLGMLCGILYAFLLKKTLFQGEPVPFVMELPSYHMPTVSNVLRSMWERGWSFIKKAGTIILLSTIVLWFLLGYGWENGAFGAVEDINNCIMARIGSVIAPVFAPLGFGRWGTVVATVTGWIAKENVVATFGQVFGFAEVAEDGVEIWSNLAASFTAVSAYSFMCFNLLCAPCFAAMGAIKREMNNTKWFLIAIGYQCGLAYLVSLCIYQIGTWITTGTFGIGVIVALAVIAAFIWLLVRPYKQDGKLKVNLKGMAKA